MSKSYQKSRQLAVGRVAQPLNPPFAHASQLVNPDGEVVQGLGGVLPVKVAGGHRLTPLSENYWIVCCAIHFRGYNSLDKLYGVMSYAMHLGSASQCVGILKHRSEI